MEKELKANILRMTENADWAKKELPVMIEKGMRVLNSEKAQAVIAEKGREYVIQYISFMLIDEYH